MFGNAIICNRIMYKALSLLHWLALIALCVWLLPTCAGNPQVSFTPVAPGLEHLPAPSTLSPDEQPIRQAMAETTLNGADYDTGLPNHRIEVVGTDLMFYINWGGYGEKTFDDLAFATYAFSPGFSSSPFSIITNWSSEPIENTFWIGLADYTADKWRWYLGSLTEPLVLSDMSTYLGMHTQLLVVIVTLSSGGPPPPAPQLATITLGDGAI